MESHWNCCLCDRPIMRVQHAVQVHLRGHRQRGDITLLQGKQIELGVFPGFMKKLAEYRKREQAQKCA